MRLDKYLAHMGFGTRSKVKTLIKQGFVRIDDQVIKRPEHKVGEDTIVFVNGHPVQYVNYEYYVLNKPAGYVSATEDRIHPSVMELVRVIRKDLAPVGRLDIDAEGLLLITNDGHLTHRLLSPKNKVPKTYYVEVEGQMPADAGRFFSQPMRFKEFTSKPATYEAITGNSAYLTIYEGKFHQVKRMFERIGCPVTYLKRVAFGPLQLQDLEIGSYRELTKEELEQLKG